MAQFDTNIVAHELVKEYAVLWNASAALQTALMNFPELNHDENGNYNQTDVRAWLDLYDNLVVTVTKPALSLNDSLAVIRAAV